MIVRESKDHFIMIKQSDHAKLSGEVFKHLNKEIFPTITRHESVLYAISHHDLGWESVDQMPFWNDAVDAPYNFMDFPIIPKLTFYTEGIENVAEIDAYAGLLCSQHYTHFVLGELDEEEARDFVNEEQNRQERLIEQIPDFDSDEFNFHYGLLILCDNLSLYMCLNKPGVKKRKEHPLFKERLFTPPQLLEFIDSEYIDIRFKNKEDIHISPFLLEEPLNITIPYKDVPKKAIRKLGLLKSYLHSPVEIYDLNLLEGKNHSSKK